MADGTAERKRRLYDPRVPSSSPLNARQPHPVRIARKANCRTGPSPGCHPAPSLSANFVRLQPVLAWSRSGYPRIGRQRPPRQRSGSVIRHVLTQRRGSGYFARRDVSDCTTAGLSSRVASGTLHASAWDGGEIATGSILMPPSRCLSGISTIFSPSPSRSWPPPAEQQPSHWSLRCGRDHCVLCEPVGRVDAAALL